MAVNIPDYSIPGTLMWEPPCYYQTLSDPESSHSPSLGRRWSLTWLQGHPRSFCQQTWLDRPVNPRPRLGLSGCAVVMEATIVRASSLPSHWSTQWAEPYVLIQALQLSKGKKTNIYTDSRYAFDTFMHMGLYIKREVFWQPTERTVKTRKKSWLC